MFNPAEYIKNVCWDMKALPREKGAISIGCGYIRDDVMRSDF